MSHLIQSIYMYDPWAYGEDAYEAEYYCIKHGNTTPKWRTVSTLFHDELEYYTSLVGSEDDDKWAHVPYTMWIDAGVVFGTSCLKSATLRFYLPEITELNDDDVDPSIRGGFFYFALDINGVEIINGYTLAGHVKVGAPAQTVDYIVDLVALGLECRPCGNIWSIRFGYSAAGYVMELDGLMTLEIVDVTF